jgi:hypothetical protein
MQVDDFEIYFSYRHLIVKIIIFLYKINLGGVFESHLI